MKVLDKIAGAAPPVFRFAPSPNGRLHLGHAFSALTGFEMARRTGGRFLLRIEDIDGPRVRPEFVTGIFDDLAWLGLTWEEPVLRQSEHLEDYAAAAEKLGQQGLLYPCFASRTEIAASATEFDPEGALVYPGIWRGRGEVDVMSARAKGEAFATRLDMARATALAATMGGGKPLTFTEFDTAGETHTIAASPERWGDVVILRRDIPASYLIAVLVDDARQGVTHVTRGMDLYTATDVQRLLQVLLGFAEPVYHHHRLLLDAGGNKLSKSLKSTSLAALRADGVTPAGIRRLVEFSLPCD